MSIRREEIQQPGRYDERTAAWDPLQIPLDRPRPPTPSYRSAVEQFTLPGTVVRSLTTLAAQQGATANLVVLTLFKTMLYRYTGHNEIVVGGVDDLRLQYPRTDESALHGALALRTSPSARLSFRDYLSQVREELQISQADAGHSTLYRSGLFQILFLIDRPRAPSRAIGAGLPAETAIEPVSLDLFLAIEARPEGMVGRFLYNIELFEPATIRRMIGHLLTLLEGAAANPACTLEALPMLTADESSMLGSAWNATGKAIPDSTAHALFEAQAARTPDAPAITFEGDVCSYRDLDRRANRLASRLAANGAGPETLVALCVERSIDMIAGLLAILKAGAAYLPLDPGFPASRLEMILDDAKPAVLLTQRTTTAALPDAAHVVYCEDEADSLHAGSACLPACLPATAHPEALAYVIYTSGSTGRPKGVEVTHRSFVNLLTSMQREPGFGAADAMLAVTTISFDIANLELLLPLISGGRIVLASREVAADPIRLAELLPRSGCTVMQATPATWRGLIEAGWKGDPRLSILCGGEAMPRDLADRLLPRCGKLWNMYGPTETTIWSTIHKVQPGQDAIPIGRPIANTTLYILDACGSLVPVGIAGELHIGGQGVARGYRCNPALTDERFITNCPEAEERLYRTGDLARYRADGVIEWLARADNQIKVRGFRIEAQDVEAALERHPEILSAAVKAWPDTNGQHSLAGYFVSTAGSQPDGAALRVFLRQSLPDYMVPTRFVCLAALPLTPNGKLDRKALPEPIRWLAAGLANAESEALIDDRERRLAVIWKALLGTGNPHPNADFFASGGDSLLAVTLMLRIEAEFGRRLTMAALFQAPTLRSMAALLGEEENETVLPLAAQIQPKGSRPSLFWIDGGPMFMPLAEALGLDQPFLGVTLQPAELKDVGFQPDLATIARHLVRTINTIQPSGPYTIGGYCAGGVLAYEVASQLMASGHAVALLCMIDAQNPESFSRVGSFAVEMAKFRHHIAQACTQARRGKGIKRLEYFAKHASSAYRRILSRSAWRPVMKSDPFTLGDIMQPAVAAYRPVQYAGRVALFQARRPRQLDLRPGWAKVVTAQLVSYDFPGAHETILKQPHVKELARLMNNCLGNSEDTTVPGTRLLSSRKWRLARTSANENSHKKARNATATGLS